MDIREKIISGTMVLSAANVLMRIFSFFTILIVVRVVSVHDYGIFTLIMSLAGLLGAWSNMGIDSLVLSDVSRNFGENNLSRAKSLLYNFWILRAGLLFIMLLVLFIIKAYLKSDYSMIAEQYFWLVVLLTLAQYMRGISSLLIQINERFKLLSITNISEVVVKFIFIIIFLLFGKLNIITLILCYIFGTFFAAIISLPQFKKTLLLFRDIPMEKMRFIYEIFRAHGKWQIANNVISSSTNTIKFWLVKVIISTEAVGYLALAQNLYSVLASLIPLGTVIFPIIARKLHDVVVLKKILQKATKYSLVLYILMIISSYVVISPLIPYVFPKYIIAIPLFNLLVLRLLFNAFSISQTPILFAYREQKFMFLCAVISFLLTFILSPVLMLRFGIIGTIIEAIITIFIVSIIREIYLRKKYGLKTIGWKSFFSVDETDKVIIMEMINRFFIIFRKKPLSISKH
ncbi:MAG: hypothetical protein COU51_04010 [Parcubacteria group bacterium CG10_big_fil_rev_8_21_14_0_10_36_14]|nr:MAG: hypothetical protein COU51_04010 [Parcubacteria group bacterium CG10_big_fil_rev_8_21_14_0_10_36_14]